MDMKLGSQHQRIKKTSVQTYEKTEVSSANADNTWQSNVGCYFWVLALQVECVELQNRELGGRILLNVNAESHSKFGISSESHGHILGIGLWQRRWFSVDHGSHASSSLCSIWIWLAPCLILGLIWRNIQSKNRLWIKGRGRKFRVGICGDNSSLPHTPSCHERGNFTFTFTFNHPASLSKGGTSDVNCSKFYEGVASRNIFLEYPYLSDC
jgi:hypothetical protein